MKNYWNKKWKILLVWASLYFDFVAFILVGGYFCIKKEDDEIIKATKQAFIVRLVFTAISACLIVLNYIGNIFNYSGSIIYNIYSIAINVLGVAKIAVIALFMANVFFKKYDKEEIEG